MRYKRQMEISVEACRDRGLRKLLVDITGLTGFKPTIQELYQIGEYGAKISTHLEKVSAFGTLEQIDPEGFAPTVARNRGLKARTFSDRRPALEWLLEPDPEPKKP